VSGRAAGCCGVEVTHLRGRPLRARAFVWWWVTGWRPAVAGVWGLGCVVPWVVQSVKVSVHSLLPQHSSCNCLHSIRADSDSITNCSVASHPFHFRMSARLFITL
jgi:hypothetical protein